LPRDLASLDRDGPLQKLTFCRGSKCRRLPKQVCCYPAVFHIQLTRLERLNTHNEESFLIRQPHHGVTEVRVAENLGTACQAA
jgi:hypothetical protein